MGGCMSKKSIHTVPKGSGWANKQNGFVTSFHGTKSAAQIEGKRQAQNSQTEHVIHNKDGKISQKNSYGNDPCPPKDKR